MTKAEIVQQVSDATGIQEKDVLVVVEGFMQAIKDSLLKKHENVYLRGFGTFAIRRRAAKTGRNISKNTAITIAAHDAPAFKPSRSLVDEMKKQSI